MVIGSPGDVPGVVEPCGDRPAVECFLADVVAIARVLREGGHPEQEREGAAGRHREPGREDRPHGLPYIGICIWSSSNARSTARASGRAVRGPYCGMYLLMSIFSTACAAVSPCARRAVA